MRTVYLSLLFCLTSVPLSAQSAINLDGTDDYITSSYAGITGSADRTIEAWLRTSANSIPGQGGQKVILNWGTMPLGTRFTFCLLFNNAIRVEIGGAGLSGNIPVNDGQWHHLAATYKSGLVNLYVDGVLDTSGNLAGVNTASGGFVIGRRVDGLNYFEGDIDEIRVWDQALNLNQLGLRDSSEYCISPANLVAYYKCNDGLPLSNNTSINSIIDYSANSNNGSLNNFSLSGTSSNFINSPVAGGGLNLSQSINSCGPYTAINGVTYQQSGQYQDTIVGAAGCDTILDLNLTVTYLDSSAQRISANTLEANETDSMATFQWLNCNTNYQVIGGAIGRQFTFVQNGSYAVEVSLGVCVDTSECLVISNIELPEWSTDGISLYPNPSRDLINISYPAGLGTKLALLNMRGEIIYRSQLDEQGTYQMDLSSIPPGLYLLQIRLGEEIISKNFQKLP